MAWSFYRHTRRIVWIVGVILISLLTLFGQTGKRLYLVTGLVPSNIWPIEVPVSLVAIDEVKSEAEKLFEIGEGSGLIKADYDRRVVVLGTAPGLVQIDMDSPTMPRTIATTSGLQYLCTPPFAIVQEGCRTTVLPERRLFGIDLADTNAGKEHELPFYNYRFVRTEGYWSPIDLENNNIFLY